MDRYLPDQIFAPADLVRQIADQGNTPFFLYHQQGIYDSVRALHAAFSWNHGYQNYFSIRENFNPKILSILYESGTGVCACSRIELELAIRCGFSGERLAYEPTRQDSEAEALAMKHNAIWICDSPALLPDPAPKKLILRYNPINSHLSSQVKPVVMRNKAGFNKAQLMETAIKLYAQGISEIGLYVQVSSYSIHLDFWARKASILLALIDELYVSAGMSVWCCHLGEGPGLAYNPSIATPDLVKAAELVRAAFERVPEKHRPVVFTGVCNRLLDPCALLVTKVLEQRTILRTFLIMDCGINQFCRHAIKQSYRHVSVLGRSERSNRRLYSIVGEFPESFDRLVFKGRMLPKVTAGDYCVIHDVGCGTRSMSMLFGFKPIAGEYLYTTDGEIIPISPRRSADEVLQFLTAW